MVSKLKKLFCCLAFSFGIMIPLASCSGNQVATQATYLQFVNESITLNVGDRQVLKYNIAPSGAKDADTFWFSSNESVAYVTKGVLMGVGKGNATISLVTANMKTSIDVTVIDAGSGDKESLTLSTNSMTLSQGSTAPLKAYANPSTAVVTWTSSNTGVATFADNTVTAVAVGTATITAALASGLTASCSITVTGGSTPEPGPGETGWTGSIRVGAPLGEIDFMKSLLAYFNSSTKSTVTFEVTQWEEGNGADNLPQALAEGPDIFPYVSDQTIAFYQRNALAALPKSSVEFISTKMGSDALAYAKLNGTNKVIGYPFSSDNGYVMFYSKKLASQAGITDMSDITMEALLSTADTAKLDVDFPITNAFYAAGSLMSYNNGKSLYTLTMKSGGTSYNVKSSFNSEAGVKAAKQIRKLFDHKCLYTSTEIPGNTVLATIVDCSKVSAMKQYLGDDYGVAPLPYIDDTKTARYANYLGYKFYGVNPARAADHINLAHAVAKYLADEYAQLQRFDKLRVKPTLASLLDSATHPEIMNEPHVKALVQQGTVNTIALTAVDTSLWSQAAVAIKSIKALSATAADSEYQSVLQEFDDSLYY